MRIIQNHHQFLSSYSQVKFLEYPRVLDEWSNSWLIGRGATTPQHSSPPAKKPRERGTHPFEDQRWSQHCKIRSSPRHKKERAAGPGEEERGTERRGVPPLIRARPPLPVIPVVMETPPRRPRAPGHPRTPQTPSALSFSSILTPDSPSLLAASSTPSSPPCAEATLRASPPGTRIDPRASSRSYVFYGECY